MTLACLLHVMHCPWPQAADLHVLPHFDGTNPKVSVLHSMPFDTVDGCLFFTQHIPTSYVWKIKIFCLDTLSISIRISPKTKSSGEVPFFGRKTNCRHEIFFRRICKHGRTWHESCCTLKSIGRFGGADQNKCCDRWHSMCSLRRASLRDPKLRSRHDRFEVSHINHSHS